MLILGFMGSPSVKGKCSRLLQKALDGARAGGAAVKQYDLVSFDIRHCKGCGACFKTRPELAIGPCPLKDDMAAILEEYDRADGYVYASPVYDGYVTSIMKKFLERKIALTYKSPEEQGKVPSPRRPVGFRKKVSYIVTGDAADEYQEIMGDPCFVAMDWHHMLEQVESLDRLYVGSAECISAEEFARREALAFELGGRLVEEIKAVAEADSAS
ncbi:MAG: flavodoxin family protein [Deltaproteobacteria bacterium]|nr:flavodoxin family protein [Deltaproteobacteria bacterium]